MSQGHFIDEFLAQEARSDSIFSHFPPAQQRAMLEEDLFAGRSVSFVLAAIVTGGMLLMAGTVLYILL